MIKALPHNVWYSFGLWSHDFAAKVPQSSVVVTLVSNFGTFLLYMMTCIVAIVAFREHHTFNGFKHMFIPIFGVAANLMCMLFYLIGPFMVNGMSWHEPYVALAIVRDLGHLRFDLFQERELEERQGDLRLRAAKSQSVEILEDGHRILESSRIRCLSPEFQKDIQ